MLTALTIHDKGSAPSISRASAPRPADLPPVPPPTRSQANGLTLKAQLYDASHQPVFSADLSSKFGGVTQHLEDEAYLESVVHNPRKWSAEDPQLYTLVCPSSSPCRTA